LKDAVDSNSPESPYSRRIDIKCIKDPREIIGEPLKQGQANALSHCDAQEKRKIVCGRMEIVGETETETDQ